MKKSTQQQEPKITIPDLVGDMHRKFDYYIKVVVAVLVVAVLTMLFMVAGILLEAWHFNSTVYQEYSSKIDTLETLQESNKTLFEQNNENQKLILEQQEQIKLLINSKND